MDHALKIVDSTAHLRLRVAAITDRIRGLPAYRRQGPTFEAALRERSELLAEIDRLSRPARTVPTRRDRRTTADLATLIAEHNTDATQDELRGRGRRPGRSSRAGKGGGAW